MMFDEQQLVIGISAGNQNNHAGIYEVDFDGSKIAAKTYIIELKAGLIKETKK